MKRIYHILLPKKYVTLLLLIMLMATSAMAQISIFANAITDTDPSTANPYTNGQTVNANLTVNGVARGSGISASSAQNRFSANGFTLANAVDANDYFEFVLTPASGYDIDFTSFVYTGQRSNTGPTSFVFRSSVDGFTSDIANFTLSTTSATATTISLSATSFQNINSVITFRLYGYNAGAAGGTSSVNDFIFNGTVASTALPLELISFGAHKELSKVHLDWSTSCNSTAKAFKIEQSIDGNQFSALANIEAQESVCNGTREYAFDAPVQAAIRSLYRLTMLDITGRENYSPVVAVMNGDPSVAEISLSPNPANSIIQVSGVTAGATWQMSDFLGHLIKTGVLATTGISVIDLPKGYYVLRCTGAQPIRFMKQ